MSQKNMEIARRMIACVNRGDDEATAALMSTDVRCHPAGEQPESKPFRGRQAYVRYARNWREAFDHYVVEPLEYRDLGETVIVSGRLVARGRKSGVETATEDAWLLRFQGGKIVEYRGYASKGAALEAAGLRE
jgi:ketosteroid isomerase-like protein